MSPPRFPITDEVHALFFDEGSGTAFTNRGSEGSTWNVEGSDWSRVTTGPFSLGEAYTGARSNNARIRGPVSGEPGGSLAILVRLKLTGSWPQGGYTHQVVKQPASGVTGYPGPCAGMETKPDGTPQFGTWRTGGASPDSVAAAATIADGHRYTLLGTYDSASGLYTLHIWDETLGAARTPATATSAGGAVDWKSHGPWLMGSWSDIYENCPMELYELRVFPSTRDAAWLAAYVAYAGPPAPPSGGFARVNGVPLPVALGGVQRDEVEVGAGLLRSFSGAALRSTQTTKRQWPLDLTPTTQEEGVALVGLLQGRGDHVSFDSDSYSDKGVGPSLSTGATRPTTAPSPKWGSARLELASGTSNQVAWPLQLGTRWTATVWRYESSDWHWYLVRDDGLTFRDGSQVGTSIPAWLQVSGGSLYLLGTSGSATTFDDLWAVPARFPTSWVAALYAQAQSGAWPQSPRLVLAGDLIPETSATVMGKVGRVRGQVGRLAGTAGFSAALEQLSVELWEA